LIRAALAKAPLDFGPGRLGAPVAENGYDLLYVKDAAQGLRRVALAPQLRHFIYNMGSGHAATHGQVARAVEQAIPGFAVTLRSRTDIGNPVQGREADMANVYLDSSRIARELGFAPRFTLEQGIRDYVSWLREHSE
jgi:nucleoside-diphosphate-sugar epimerase